MPLARMCGRLIERDREKRQRETGRREREERERETGRRERERGIKWEGEITLNSKHLDKVGRRD